MTEVTDNDLLARFRQGESDEVFAKIVDRYIHLVYSVALRHTANPHHAEEITQAVFIILARRARSLGRQTVLSGWLYHAARLTAANFLRSEIRRSRREQEAFMRSTLEETQQGALWHVTHHIRSQADPNGEQAFQNKLEAERADGSRNVAPDPGAQKLEAEQKEKELKASRDQQAQPQKQ